MTQINTVGEDVIFGNISKVITRVNAGVRSGLSAFGDDLKKTAKTGIKNSPKTGARYYYKGLGWTNASIKGNYPANQTGRLSNSISRKMKGARTLEFGSKKIAATYQYQRSLEGRKDRPFMKLTHNKNIGKFQNDMDNSVQKELGNK